MRFLRFLLKEFVLHGIVFAVVGTLILSVLYLLSIGASPDMYLDTGRSFLLMLIGSDQFGIEHAGFTPGQIIASGAKITLPLALISLVILIVIAMITAAHAMTSRYLASHHDRKAPENVGKVLNVIMSILAATPLFCGFWALMVAFGTEVPSLIIAFLTVIIGGLSWDAANFLKADMLAQIETTHAITFSTLGHKLGRFFPLPGTYSGYIFASSLPRFIPYIAGKVPAIIGSVTIAEIIFSFPGLGSTLLDAMGQGETSLLIMAVFILLCVNAVVSFLVKTILFLIYPRCYEKSI